MTSSCALESALRRFGDEPGNRIDYTLDAMGKSITERTSANGGGLLVRAVRITVAVVALLAVCTESMAGGLIEVRREPKFVYYNGYASYPEIDHDSPGDAFAYGQGFNDFCYGTVCYYTINFRPQASNQAFGFTYNGKPYYYVSDRKICQSGVCNAPIEGAGMAIAMKILCDTANGWYARQTNTDSLNRQIACTKYVSEDEFTCKDPRFGNPLIPGLGIKYQAEVDYGFVNSPFAFTRIYRSDRGWVDSATGLRLVSYVGDVPDLSICTPGTYERKVSPTGPLQKVPYCFPLIGVSLSEYDLQTNDGRLIRFSGSTPLPKADVNSRLQRRLVNGVTQWFLFDETNRLTIYGANGLPITTMAADGRSVSYAFVDGPAAGAKVLSTVTEWTGRQLVFSHDASRRVSSMRTPDGRYFSYAYDGTTSNCSPAGACSNLTSVTYPDNTARKFHYNESQFTANTNVPRLLTGISDETGARFATFSYDMYSRAVGTQYAGGANAYAMTSNTGWARVTDPLGSLLTMSFTSTPTGQRMTYLSQPAGAGCGPASSSITYDANANVTSRTDFNGLKTCYANDLTRNLETKRVEGVAAGADCTTSQNSPPAGARLISTQWHPDWRFETRIAEPNKITTIVYNGQGASCAPSTVLVDGKPPAVVCSRSEQATTDATGALGFAAGLTGTPRTWSYTYTTYGRVLAATDPNGKITTTTYYPDDDPDMGRRGNVATVTNAANHLTRFAAYNLHGQPTQIVDPNGLVTDLTYDLRLRLTTRKAGNELTTFTYDPRGLLTNVTLPEGARVTYTYDAAHRLVAIADQQGNRIDYTLDAMGNRITEKASDNSGALVRNIQRTIDALNRVHQITGAD